MQTQFVLSSKETNECLLKTKDKNRVMEQSDADILVNFAKSILDGTRSLDDDISKLVDENLWDLV